MAAGTQRARVGISLAAALALTLGACADEKPAPTAASDVVALFTTADACTSTLNKQIQSEQNAMFTSSTLKTARTLWAPVVTNCSSNRASAQQSMLAYVSWTIGAYKAGLVVPPKASTGLTAADEMVAHWNDVFLYVGLPAPSLTTVVLTDQGAVGVIGPEGGDLITGLKTAALRIAANSAADGGSHLFSITPNPPNCLTATVLAQDGPCFGVSDNPTTSFSPLATVTICEHVPVGQALGYRQLAHQPDPSTTKVTVPASNPFVSVGLCPDGDFGLGPQRHGLLYAVGRFAARIGDFVSPPPVYAVHSGLTGKTGTMSPFGGVFGLAFGSRFNGNPIGQPPVSPLTSPDLGTWTATATPPGSILVQPSLGDLTDTVVVLNQAGGNCGAACGGLTLTGKVGVALDQLAPYLVSWQSVQSKPSDKGAPFVLRSADSLVIAVLSYVTVPAGNFLSYNGTLLDGTNSTVRVPWVTNKSQRIQICVSPSSHRTGLLVDGQPIVKNAPFVTSTAGQVAYVAAEFSGIDSGIMGWDNISILRQSDEISDAGSQPCELTITP